MSINRRSLGAAAIALILISSLPSFGDTMTESSAVQTTIDQMSEAFVQRDMARVLATYEANAVLVAQPGAVGQGTPALQKMFEEFFALKPKLTFTGQEVFVAGDIALHFNTWKMDGELPDGTKVGDGGLSVVVLRKQADGKWLMVIDNPHGGHLLKAK